MGDIGLAQNILLVFELSHRHIHSLDIERERLLVDIVEVHLIVYRAIALGLQHLQQLLDSLSNCFTAVSNVAIVGLAMHLAVLADGQADVFLLVRAIVVKVQHLPICPQAKHAAMLLHESLP